MKIIPYSILPNSIYLPLHSEPKQEKWKLSDLDIESDVTGVQSIISLNGLSDAKHPFIDFSKYDIDYRNWLWFDDQDGLPYRLEKNQFSKKYSFNSIYGIQSSGFVFGCDSLTTKYDDVLGVSSVLTQVVNTTADQSIKKYFYQYSPISLYVKNSPAVDITDYNKPGNQSVSSLLKTNVSDNPQFLYGFDGRIYTNLDLSVYDPKDVFVVFYTITDSVSVKCKLAANSDGTPYYTPTVDYYILKLVGQEIR